MPDIHTFQTYNPADATSTGYDVAIRDDGTMRLTKHSRWQGTMNGTVHIGPTPPEISRALEHPSDDEPDVETAFANWMERMGDFPPSFRKIRLGHLIQ